MREGDIERKREKEKEGLNKKVGFGSRNVGITERELAKEGDIERKTKKEGLNKKVVSGSRKCGHHREINSEREGDIERKKKRIK